MSDQSTLQVSGAIRPSAHITYDGQEFHLRSERGVLIMRIPRDGKVVISPEYDVAEASRLFWDALRRFWEKVGAR